MTDKKDAKDTLLKEVRSILLPEQRGLTCGEFLKTWRLLLGYPFPVTSMGYNTPEEFFKSIPDVVTLSYEGADIRLKAVPTEATKHIARMVACQKTSSKKRSKGKGRGKQSYYPNKSSSSRGQFSSAADSFSSRTPNKGFPPKLKAAGPVVPPVQRGQIQELLRIYGINGIVAANFDIAFTRKYGQCLSPKNLGFNSLHDLLKSLADIVQVEDLPTGYKIFDKEAKQTTTKRNIKVTGEANGLSAESKPKHNTSKKGVESPSKLVTANAKTEERTSKKKNKKNKKSCKMECNQEVHRDISVMKTDKETFKMTDMVSGSAPSNEMDNGSDVDTSIETVCDGVTGKNSDKKSGKNTDNVVGNSTLTCKDAVKAVDAAGIEEQRDFKQASTRRSPSRTIPPRLQKQNQNSYLDIANDGEECDEDWSEEDQFAIGDEDFIGEDNSNIYGGCTDLYGTTKQNIKEILARHPSGVSSASFLAEYKRYTAKELQLHGLGYHSVIELMSSLSDVVSIKRVGSSDWMLYSVTGRRSPSPVVEPVSPRRLSGERPSFNTAPPLPGLFSETIRQVMMQCPDGILMQDLPSKFKSLTGQEMEISKLGYNNLEALITQMSDVVSMNCVGKGIIMLFPVDVSLPYRDDLLFKKHQQKEKRRGVPQNAIGPGMTYKHLPLPMEQIGEYLDVFISHIDSPGRIFLQIKGPRTTEALEDLMDKLDNFYNHPLGEDYAMPERLVRVGLICAALYPEDNNWHRVTITGLKDCDFIEVYFVDYGTSCTVTRRSLRLLSSQFIQLPAQAIRARLANILPVDKLRWTRSATTRLLDLTSLKPLKALVTDIDKHRIVSVCLCDTSGEEDIHINDLLVVEEHAVIAVDSEASPVAHNVTMDILGTAETQKQLSAVPQTTAQLSAQAAALPAEARALSERTESSSEYENRSPTNIMCAELCDNYTLYLVKLEDKCWAIAGDISRLIWERDQLGSMIRKYGLTKELTKVVISEDTHPELFSELEEYGDVPGAFTDDGILRSHIALYHIDSVLKILDTFKKPPSEELRAAVADIAENFDPNDPHWLGEADGEDESKIGLEELEIGLQILNHKRKMTLHSMQDAADSNMADHVEELGLIEEQLRAMNLRISKAKQSVSEAEASKMVTSKLTPEESFVGDIVSKQSSGYFEKNQDDINTLSDKTPSVATKPAPLIQTVAPTPIPAGNPLNVMPNPASLPFTQLPVMRQQMPTQPAHYPMQFPMIVPGNLPQGNIPQFMPANVADPSSGVNTGQGVLPQLTPVQQEILQQYQNILFSSMGRGGGSHYGGNFSNQ